MWPFLFILAIERGNKRSGRRSKNFFRLFVFFFYFQRSRKCVEGTYSTRFYDRDHLSQSCSAPSIYSQHPPAFKPCCFSRSVKRVRVGRRREIGTGTLTALNERMCKSGTFERPVRRISLIASEKLVIRSSCRELRKSFYTHGKIPVAISTSVDSWLQCGVKKPRFEWTSLNPCTEILIAA